MSVYHSTGKQKPQGRPAVGKVCALKTVKSLAFTGVTLEQPGEHWKQPSTLHGNTPPLTANQQNSTAAQLRLVHKRYTRENIRVRAEVHKHDNKQQTLIQMGAYILCVCKQRRTLHDVYVNEL